MKARPYCGYSFDGSVCFARAWWQITEQNNLLDPTFACDHHRDAMTPVDTWVFIEYLPPIPTLAPESGDASKDPHLTG